MRRPRHALVLLLVLGLLGFALPAWALGAGGTCASCQQYTDPFGGSGSQSSSHRTTTSAPTTTSSAPATTPAPVTAPAAATTTAGPSVTADPTATAASPTSTSTAGTLPYTGYDGGLAALLGGGLVLSGAALRIRFRKRS